MFLFPFIFLILFSPWEKPQSPVVAPMDRAAERITKKPFGLYLTPATSPVQPERFFGYHTGTDFEIFPGEENENITVKAVCDGVLLMKQTANGYGGVAVQSGKLDGLSVTIVYGHLRLSSITLQPGESIKAGQVIGFLGNAYSEETDGERKHLHLSIHRGKDVNIRGYVTSQEALKDWIDPCKYVCGN